MFGISFNDREARALLELLGFIAQSDRTITPKEKDYIFNRSHDLNISSEGVLDGDPDRSITDICNVFETPQTRRLALSQVIELGFIDGAYGEDEWIDIREIARLMEVNEVELAKLEDWVSRGIQWKKEGRRLLKSN
jgi:hypothetical protein